MKKNIIKGILVLIISFVISLLWFQMSIVMMLIIYGFLEMIVITSDDGEFLWKKSKKYKYMLLICCLGATFILMGLKLFDNDLLIILGAMLFAPTLAGLLIKDVYENMIKKI